MARQVLTIAGAIVGSAFGMPQLGFALGSLIGNAVDPVQIQGPKIGDLQVQTSRDGVPRPIVFELGAVAGNIIDRSEPKIVKKKERAGKGGPVTVTEHVYMSFAIRIAEGPVTSISRVWENEKLVYDVRPGANFSEDSAEFIAKVTFYLGGETQLPDPTLESIHGIGNTPAHRGTCYAVWKDKDLTDFGGAIPQYRFEVNGKTSVDANAGYVVSQMRGDSLFNDETGKTWQIVTGAPVVSTAVGNPAGAGPALYFNGSSSLGLPHTSDLNISGMDATLELWAYIPNASGATAHQIIHKTGWPFTQGQGGFYAYFVEGGAPQGNSSSGWRLQAYDNTFNFQPLGGGGDLYSSVSDGVWTHFEVDITPSTAIKSRIFKNGVLMQSHLTSLTNIDQAISMIMGGPSSNQKYFTGYVAGWRMTAGVARHTSNFTPPTILPSI